MAFLDETGLTHLWGKITNKFLAKSNVANNLTTTSKGYALDARQGAALMAAINGGSMKLVPEILINKKYDYSAIESDNIDKTYTFKHNCILCIAIDSPDKGEDVVTIYVAGIEHNIYARRDDDASSKRGNYQAFIPAGTTVRLKRNTRNSEWHTGILATVLYIE